MELGALTTVNGKLAEKVGGGVEPTAKRGGSGQDLGWANNEISSCSLENRDFFGPRGVPFQGPPFPMALAMDVSRIRFI